MKRILFLLAFVSFANFVNAQEKVQLDNGPKFKFEQTEIDYGTIKKGSDGTRYFNFSNDGVEPLIISNVRSSCGCTVPEYDKNPIPTGGESQIKVVYDTKRVGPFRKIITIYSNTKEGKNLLVVKGKVE